MDWAEEIVFDANLTDFASKVGIIVALEQSGKFNGDEAYKEIKKLWKKLKKSKKNLDWNHE